ncbi:plasmid replication protein RepC [Marivita sp. S0852]|uniref:plasmid replication protein RepC n=1 Tax=Marivita sp. S0852 TaxID=3373893 RepID=UPI0039821626
MSYAFQTPVGRPVEACPNTDIPAIGPDKWHLLSALTDAADRFGLTHRPICVLRALLTFLPERHIPQGHRAIVFPANRTLADRLGGMPESTLRRHLAALVKSGLVSRHDSPNRKRYARRVKGGIAMAFGINLAPLVTQARAILTAATEAREEAERLRVLRDRVIALRHDLVSVDRAGQAAKLCEEVRRALRRKLTKNDLTDMLHQLETAIDTCTITDPDQQQTKKMSASDNQNERHIQGKDIKKTDSETPQNQTPDKDSLHSKTKGTITLKEVIDRCPGFKCFFPEPVTSWRDLEEIASRLAPMMGIEAAVFIEARHRMGAGPAMIAVLYIHERLAKIENPGAYLRSLSQCATPQGFDVRPLLAALKDKKLSADNSNT